jgi:Zn-dependent protease with chaperone function
MDFFAHQERARRNTKWLIAYFVLAVAAMIAAIYLACAAVLPALALEQHEPAALWNPPLFAGVAGGVSLVILIGSWVRTAELSSGGSAVAQALGGRLLNPQTRDPDERKLLNVVEEMSIASGVPVPEVYVLDEETGINAFAAGHSPSDAAIGVTRGAMCLLSRDELQGVIAHEFSHLLNGDMRLNLRLMGVLFGILCLTIIGRVLLRSHGGRRNPLPILGLVLVCFGSIGLFFGRLIKSAVSRQREFLADAAAVQFTRYPAGLAGALKKIGGLARGSLVAHAAAEEASHMFFGNALRPSWFNFLATHPPLEVRIRRIEPDWDGVFPKVTAVPVAAPAVRRQPALDEPAAAARPPQRPSPPAVPPRLPVTGLLQHIGAPTAAHLVQAAALRASIPPVLEEAAHEPFDAGALVLAVLLSPEAPVRAEQLRGLQAQVEPALFGLTLQLMAAVEGLPAGARLALVERALPALRRLPAARYASFRQAVRRLIESDRQVDLFEYALQKMLLRHLEPHFTKAPPRLVQFYALAPLLPDCQVLLSALAHLGQTEPGEAERAFAAGVSALRVGPSALRLLPWAECNLPQIDAALERLSQATPYLKKLVLHAGAAAVAADGLVREKEAELLRAIGDTLECPIPPLLPPE